MEGKIIKRYTKTKDFLCLFFTDSTHQLIRSGYYDYGDGSGDSFIELIDERKNSINAKTKLGLGIISKNEYEDLRKEESERRRRIEESNEILEYERLKNKYGNLSNNTEKE